jgi:hypothetical protein
MIAPSLLLVAGCACGWAADSPAPLGRKQVKAALGASGLTVLPDLKLPPGKVMDYGFEGRHGEFVMSTVVIYPTTQRARHASLIDQRGAISKTRMIIPTKTLRVRNVLLVFGRPTNRQWRALVGALARLGKPVSP